MLSSTAICLLIVVHSFFQFVLSLQFLSQPQEPHYFNVNIKGDGYFYISKVGDSELPIPIPASVRQGFPDRKPVVITVNQRSNYLENLYAMEKKLRDKKILDRLKEIIKESGKMSNKSGRVRKVVRRNIEDVTNIGHDGVQKKIEDVRNIGHDGVQKKIEDVRDIGHDVQLVANLSSGALNEVVASGGG